MGSLTASLNAQLLPIFNSISEEFPSTAVMDSIVLKLVRRLKGACGYSELF